MASRWHILGLALFASAGCAFKSESTSSTATESSTGESSGSTTETSTTAAPQEQPICFGDTKCGASSICVSPPSSCVLVDPEPCGDEETGSSSSSSGGSEPPEQCWDTMNQPNECMRLPDDCSPSDEGCLITHLCPFYDGELVDGILDCAGFFDQCLEGEGGGYVYCQPCG